MSRGSVNAVLLWGALGLCATLNAPARAEETPRTRSAAMAHLGDRPYTQAELGVGMMTLPTTEFCLSAPSTCTRGDTSPEGFLLMMYRPNRQFGFGAGATIALPSGSDKPDSGSPSLDRSHSRSYLMVDATVRYYGLQINWLEGWVGGSLGGVVINDLYSNNAENPSAPILGPKGVRLRTEGMSAGIEAGIAWPFATNLSVSGLLRTAWWFLPDSKACGPTGDCATLSGETAMFSLSVALTYKIGL